MHKLTFLETLKNIEELYNQNEAYKKLMKQLVIPRNLTDDEFNKLRDQLITVGLNRAMWYCAFPGRCGYYDTCTDNKCDATELSNSYPGYR